MHKGQRREANGILRPLWTLLPVIDPPLLVCSKILLQKEETLRLRMQPVNIHVCMCL